MTDFASAKLGAVRDIPSGPRRDSFLVALVTLLAALAAFPFNRLLQGDDASYVMTARVFAHTGHFVYNGWAAASLGWQVVWGALFIRLFGDSAFSLVLSTIVVGMITIFLWHRALLHFGMGRRNAFLVALTFACSPLYLILLNSFMTDIPGLLTFAVCVSMCQRAILARNDRATVLWLLSACAVNLVGGSVRQICWLGALVMVPSTAWLLRKRQGALFAGVASLSVGPIVIQGCMHWYLRQPYIVPEKYLLASLDRGMLRNLIQNWSEALLLLTAAVAPVAIAWISQVRILSHFAKLRIILGMTLGALFLLRRAHQSTLVLAQIVFPGLQPIYETCGFPYGAAVFHWPAVLGLFGRGVLSVLVLGLLLVLLELFWRYCRPPSNRGPELRAMFWILVPYTLAYVAVVSGRAMFGSMIQDRYLLILAPIAMVWMARLYELRIDLRMPTVCVVAMVLVAIFSIAADATNYSLGRANIRLDERWRGAGMPRSEISEGFGMDLGEQISDGGHVNDKRVKNMAEGYDASVPHWDLPLGCEVFYDQWFSKVRPKYFTAAQEDSHCFVKSDFPPEDYRAYLPPFHRHVIVVRSAAQAKASK